MECGKCKKKMMFLYGFRQERNGVAKDSKVYMCECGERKKIELPIRKSL